MPLLSGKNIIECFIEKKCSVSTILFSLFFVSTIFCHNCFFVVVTTVCKIGWTGPPLVLMLHKRLAVCPIKRLINTSPDAQTKLLSLLDCVFFTFLEKMKRRKTFLNLVFSQKIEFAHELKVTVCDPHFSFWKITSPH
jgi:hypothetical protein